MKLKKYLPYLWNIPYSIYFNFKLLPFKQALHLPVLLIKPNFVCLKGKIKISDDICTFGLIKLGGWEVKSYPNSGITLNLQGGIWYVKGKCWIGSNSSIEIGENAKLTTGIDFLASTSLKLYCYRDITFGISTRLGWEVTVMDTNFHPLKKIDTNIKSTGGAAIYLGDYNWCGSKCVIMPGVKTKNRCIFSFGSVLTKKMECEQYAIHAGNPAHIVSTGWYRDINDDKDEAVYGKK